MDFSLSDEQKMVQQTVRTFVERELMPLEREVMQSEGKYPTGIEPTLYKSLQQKAKDLGFWGINTPEEYGGANLGAVMTALIAMEMGRTLVPFTSGCTSGDFVEEHVCRKRALRRPGEAVGRSVEISIRQAEHFCRVAEP